MTDKIKNLIADEVRRQVNSAVTKELKELSIHVEEESFSGDPEDTSRCFIVSIKLKGVEITEDTFDIS